MISGHASLKLSAKIYVHAKKKKFKGTLITPMEKVLLLISY